MEFAAENGHGPLTLHWWHGSLNEAFEKHNTKPNGNTLFVGDKGTISAGFNGYQVTMKDGSTPVPPEQTIPKSPGFHQEWIQACKGGPRSTCDFVEYTGPLAESVLLANAAFRSGGGFDWNAKTFEASGNDKVEQYIMSDFRPGWQVDEI